MIAVSVSRSKPPATVAARQTQDHSRRIIADLALMVWIV